MENPIPELEDISRKLMSMQTRQKKQKPKMMVVDDEPDNLDLLYRTFRREFQVYKADSGIKALEILGEEGEVAVIISDQRMPEMKGTEFLSKTVPDFPNTMRIILTGFTDVEDLVDAINSGQVYKYITKPWDPNDLKGVVQRAVETYELLRQKTLELQRAEAQMALLKTIVQVAGDESSLSDSLEPIAIAFGKNFAADVCILQLVEAGQLQATQGSYGTGEVSNWLAEDPLVQEAISAAEFQISPNIPGDKAHADVEHYKASGIKAHLVTPIIYQSEMLAVLSLQWQQPSKLREDELVLIHLCAQQVGLVLVCARDYKSPA
ncbi:MAG: response regulator [Hormoscilla sp.]